MACSLEPQNRTPVGPPKVTPIVFAIPLEDSEEEEEEDGASADSADSAEAFKFGASLHSQKLEPTEGSPRLFCHKFVHMSPDHEVFEKIKEDDMLYAVNGHDVTSWNHEVLIETLQNLCEEIKLVFYRENIHFTGEAEVIKKEYITVTFTLCGLDCDAKGVIDDLSLLIKNVTWSFSTNTTTIDVSNMVFQCSEELRIRHRPTQQFLMVKKNKPVVESLGDSSGASRFNVLSYSIMEKLTDKRDGKEQEIPKFMVAIQCVNTHKFLMCSRGSRKLSLVQDEDIDPKMSDVKPNAPCLFLMWKSSDGTSFFFESLAYPDNFMAYDPVRLLRMTSMDPPPYSDRFKENDFIRRNFIFELM